MCDKLVFDLAQEIEGSPSVFVRKDWLNILDNQNQNYNNNQSVIDTSQLSNSNKWMNYREAYFSIPFLITLGQSTAPAATVSGTPSVPLFNTATSSVDYAYGLKNWFGQIIHSFTLDYNGTTIIQQTPYSSMWNSFKLMTSLSYNDLITQGDVIGFFPDDATSWEWNYAPAVSSVAPSFPNGTGVCNNTASQGFGQSSGALNEIDVPSTLNSGTGNIGFTKRCQNINFDVDGIPSYLGYQYASGSAITTAIGGTYGSLISGTPSNYLATQTAGVMNNIWKSYIQTKGDKFIQTAVVATVYLKHIHSFFNMVPLLKGVFMKMTMNLNNTTVSFTMASQNQTASPAVASTPVSLAVNSVQIATGGVCPLMISAPIFNTTTTSTGDVTTGRAGSFQMLPTIGNVGAYGYAQVGYTLNLSVGATCLTTFSLAGVVPQSGTLSKSVYLYIPAYTFNPPFESSYLSSPVKAIKYTDIYQYQVLNIQPGGQFNNLLTNGIANIKSVLILPYYSSGGQTSFPLGAGVGGISINTNSGFTQGIPVFQSPFDTAGCGPTSPLCFLSNFNVQVSGQNAIYNIQRYSFEQFNNQLYGQNSVNGGLTDGLTSGLIGRTQFDMEYCYYYVNVERMLPVEESVPKSIQILGTNQSSKFIDLYCFIEYGMEVKIDALTGARV